MWNKNTFTSMTKVDWPIVQGPFGSGLSSVQLASAVSNSGGLGSFGAHYMKPGEITDLVKELRGATGKPFAVNLWVSDHDPEAEKITVAQFETYRAHLAPLYDRFKIPLPQYPQIFGERFENQIQALLDSKLPVFSFVFGIPSQDILEECRRRGIVTMGTAITVEEAIALDKAGVDIIVASGFEAGGHRVAFLKPAEESLVGTFSLIPMVADRVRAPIVAAGGICDGRGVAAALTLGASAVQVGSAFLACDESNACKAHKELLRSKSLKPTSLTRAFTGRLARGIENQFVKDFSKPIQNIGPYPVQAWLTAKFKAAAMAAGDTEYFALWAGQAYSQITHTKAAELVTDLVMQTENIFANRNQNQNQTYNQIDTPRRIFS